MSAKALQAALVDFRSRHARSKKRQVEIQRYCCALIGFDVPPPFPVTYHRATLTPDAFFDSLAATYNDRFVRRRRRTRR